MEKNSNYNYCYYTNI